MFFLDDSAIGLVIPASMTDGDNTLYSTPVILLGHPGAAAQKTFC